MSKRFMHVSIAILCLALAYHFGSRSAGAQTGGSVVNVTGGYGGWMTMLNSGDAYWSVDNGLTWQYRGNVFGGPTPVEHPSLGQVKARYR